VKIIIALVGGLICLAGLLILISPAKFRDLFNNFTGQPRYLFAIIFRILFGAVLLWDAANLKFSFAMQIIGAISIVAAIGLLLMGQDRMDRFIDWYMSKFTDTLMRVWSVLALAFGVFLVYVTL
jgi:hypothetical protein